MTETEKMRAILHERGIEYRDVNSMVTDVEHDGIKTRVYDYDDGPDYQLCIEQKWLTAEEAVRVALGIKTQEVLERRIDELRELCAGLLTGYECGYGELCKGCSWDGLGDSETFSCLPRSKARELGVEVDA